MNKEFIKYNKDETIKDIIQGLQFALEHDVSFDTSNDAITAAILMLREQQQHIEHMKWLMKPKVMTQTEVFMEHNSSFDGCIWLETKSGALAQVFPDKTEAGEIRVFSPYLLQDNVIGHYFTWWNVADYNIQWRCWTDRPDETQRNETPWH